MVLFFQSLIYIHSQPISFRIHAYCKGLVSKVLAEFDLEFERFIFSLILDSWSESVIINKAIQYKMAPTEN
jgi:hypothetical protein